MVEYITLRLINHTKYKVFNGSHMYKQDLDAFSITFLITSSNRKGKPWTIMNFSTNGCEYLEKASSRGKIFPYTFLTELYTNNPDFPKKCPLKKVF